MHCSLSSSYGVNSYDSALPQINSLIQKIRFCDQNRGIKNFPESVF